MDGVPWALDELPRGKHQNLMGTGDIHKAYYSFTVNVRLPYNIVVTYATHSFFTIRPEGLSFK